MSDKFAVIKTGGKQYKVSEGDRVKIEKLSKKEGSVFNFDQVLLYVDGRGVDVGTPILKSVKVSGKILEQGKAPKVIVYKYKKRKRYSKKKGHRQPYTEVEITLIEKIKKRENTKTK